MEQATPMPNPRAIADAGVRFAQSKTPRFRGVVDPDFCQSRLATVRRAPAGSRSSSSLRSLRRP
jgi:hypothetical protein